MYLVFCVAMLTNDMLEKNRANAVGIVVGVLFSFFIILLAARMAIISFVLVMLCLIVHHGRKRATGKLILFLGSFLLILFTLIWISPVSRFRIIQEPLSTSLEVDASVKEWNSVSLRVLEWKASWHQLKSSWLFGVGTGDGQAALQEFYSNFSANTAQLKYNSHNQYLQTGLELGAVGVLALLLCFFKPFFGSSQPHHLQILLVVIFSVMCITESMLARQKGVVFFTLFQSIFLRNLR